MGPGCAPSCTWHCRCEAGVFAQNAGFSEKRWFGLLACQKRRWKSCLQSCPLLSVRFRRTTLDRVGGRQYRGERFTPRLQMAVSTGNVLQRPPGPVEACAFAHTGIDASGGVTTSCWRADGQQARSPFELLPAPIQRVGHILTRCVCRALRRTAPVPTPAYARRRGCPRRG